MTAWYGCKPDEDKSGPVFSPPSFARPDEADLFEWFPDVMNQSASGSCTAHGALNAARYYIIRSQGRDADFPLSRLQLYWDSRAMEGTTALDEGAQIANVIKTLSEKGCCREDLWPFNLTKLFQAPPDSVYADAVKYRAQIFNRVRADAESVKQAIALGHPVIMGLQIFPSFESAEVARTGIVPMPLRGERPISGHCMAAGAYGPNRTTARNQWAPTWGDGGNCHFQDEYIALYGNDFWIIDYFS